MKKILIITFLFLLSSCHSDFITFKNNISIYKSYNPNYLKNYYESYKTNHSYIQSLNLINHPSFYTTSYNQIYYDEILLVNKLHGLTKDFIPKNLVEVKHINFVKRNNEVMMLDKTALINLELLFMDAKSQNIDLLLYSAYRSYDKQLSLWKTTPTFDDLYKAVPGYSEHQTGLAVDISTIDDGLTNNKTKAYEYLEKNSYKYGFILRYPKDKTNITGYAYEAWHFRYVGNISTFIYENNLTLEEYIYNYIEIK